MSAVGRTGRGEANNCSPSRTPLPPRLAPLTSAIRIAFETSVSSDTFLVPRKTLIADLEKQGFVDRGGKGSHRNFIHHRGVRITISGGNGDDAKHYQERDLKRALERIRS